MMMRLHINGARYDLQLEPRVSLLDALREYLGLSGTKKGCNQGACGACTVLVDGERINSCFALAVQYQGREITTIEGVAAADQLHPLQAAFIEYDGFQCGYCTPGQICSAIGMVEEYKQGMPSAVTENHRRDRHRVFRGGNQRAHERQPVSLRRVCRHPSKPPRERLRNEMAR